MARVARYELFIVSSEFLLWTPRRGKNELEPVCADVYFETKQLQFSNPAGLSRMDSNRPAESDPQKQPYTATSDSPSTTNQEAVARRGVPLSRWIAFLSIACGGAAADLYTKQAIFQWRGLPNEQPAWWLVENYLGIETAVNIGAVFGIGAGQGTLFAALSVLAGIGVVTWLFVFGAARSWWMCVALAMVSGGIVGNLYDRLGFWWQEGMPVEWKSGVRDWILMQAGDAYKWPNYNIADSLLVIGAGMLVWHSFFPGDSLGQVEPDNSSTRSKNSNPSATT